MNVFNSLTFYSRAIFWSAFLISCSIIFPAFTQPDLNFIRFTSEHGLANDDVLSICQDQSGFIWFGTKDGCSRFDGMKFKTFQYNKNNQGGIAPGWVNGIVCDKNNTLWMALSGEGSPLMKYDQQKEVFIDMADLLREHIKYKGEKFNCWTIFMDSDNLIWIQLKTTDQYILQINPLTTQIRTIEIKDSEHQDFFAKDFFEDTDKNIWCIGNGITVYNKKSGTYKLIEKDNQDIISSGECAFRDSENQIWIGANGLCRINPHIKGNAIVEEFKHDPANPFSLSNNLVYGITEDINDNIIIGTINGLCLLDKGTKKIYQYFNDETDPESINSNLIRTVYKDKNNTIWVGTSSGIGKLQTKNFKTYSHSLFKNSISHNKIQCVCQAQGADVWIGTPKGIDIFDRNTGEFRLYAGITNNSNGLYGAPLDIKMEEERRSMWVGTWRGGFSQMDYSTDEITNYIAKPATNKISHVFAVFPDNNNNLWIGVSSSPLLGVCIYNIKKGTFRLIKHIAGDETSLTSGQIKHITEDSEGRIWIGTANGLNVNTDINEGSFKRYLKGVPINHITQTSDNLLWIGTENGLYRLNISTQKLTKFDSKNGLPGDKVKGILADEFNVLWLSTNKGLARFMETGSSGCEVSVYRKEDGIRAGSFLSTSCEKLSDGAMIFGGTKGFCLFYPHKIKKDTVVPEVVFTNLKISNRNVMVDDTINNQLILPQSIATIKHLVLNHKNNEFVIEFAGLQYNMPQYNSYAYRLDGHDLPEQWHYKTAIDSKVEYMNLPRGDYTLKVKAANSFGVWNNHITELKITILPPWWNTYWFIAICIALLVFVFLVIVKIRIYSLQKQKQKLEKKVNQRTIELQEMYIQLEESKEEVETQSQEMAHMNKKLLQSNAELELKTIEIEDMAKKVHEADQKQLRFFANISHEFRTPLSLIIGPLDKYLNVKKLNHVDEWKTIFNHLQLMQKNAKRLLRLVNEIIDFRKLNSGNKTLNVSSNNIIEFIHEIMDVFSPMAETKDIHLSFIIEHLSKNIDHPTFNIEQDKMTNDFWFDPGILEKILYNLISNAIKYTPEGGQISIAISIVETLHATSPPKLAIKISDTGIGIKPENINKIFDRFYRENTNEGNNKDGTGIGLAFTKELVEYHKGTISVESIQGKGSTFILKFPFENKNATKEPIKKPSPHKLKYTKSMMETSLISGPTSPVNIGINSELPKKTEGNINADAQSDHKHKSSILLVEDNQDLRTFIKNELESGNTIFEAQNGEEAWEIAVSKDPDLIISDIMMPVMDGIELCAKLKSDDNTSHIPIILLTAKEGEENMLLGLETGADEYITKPFSMSILNAKIKNILKTRKQLQEKFGKSIEFNPSEYTHTSIDKKFLEKANQIVIDNLNNQQFTNEIFISQMEYARSKVYKKIKSLTNESVSGFIRNIRLKSAAQHFLSGKNNVAEVCYLVGFKDPSTFSRYFSQMFGKPPREFLKDNSSEK